MTMKKRITKKTLILLMLSLSLFCCAPAVYGSPMTTIETSQSITIPITQWSALKNELNLLNQDLIVCQQDLIRLKKPSQTLVEELTQAQNLQKRLQSELTECKADLIQLSNEVGELRTLSATLKQQIDRERRIHNRQVCQNRIWFLVAGIAVGASAK